MTRPPATLLLVLVSLAGCTPPFRVPGMTDEEKRALPDCSHLGILDRKEALEIIRKNRAAMHDLQSLATAELTTPDRFGTFDGALVIRWPDAMRLKGFRGTGATFLDLLVDPSGATLFLPGEGKAYVAGPDDPVPLGEGQRTLTVRRFLNALAGPPTDEIPLPTFHRPQHAWVLDAGDGSHEYDPRTLFLRKSTYRRKGDSVALTVTHREYRLADGVWFPRIIEVEDSEGSFSIRMLLREPSLNQGLVPQAFEMALPDGIDVIRKNE